MDRDATEHVRLVDERLVCWHFYASLVFLFISMLAGLLMALQLVHWNPLNGLELFAPGRWRHGAYQCHSLWIFGQRISGASLGSAPLDSSACCQPETFLFHFRCLAVDCSLHCCGHRDWSHAPISRLGSACQRTLAHPVLTLRRGLNGPRRHSGSILWHSSA